MKHRLCSTLVLSLPDLQNLFKIETDASYYVARTIITQHAHLVAYHSETLSDIVWKYPTYDKEMYPIVQYCRQWKHYILGKETIIHTDQKPLQFNIKYKKGSTNHVDDFLSRLPISALTKVLHSYVDEAYEWPQLYQHDPDFATTYRLLGT
jgi:hypothetical protein